MRGARTLRAVGSGHSFTDIACTDGVLVDLARMRRVLGRATGTDVTVEAGITLRDLGEELASARARAREPGRRGQRRRSPARSRRPPTAPAARFRNISSQVVGMRIVDGRGRGRRGGGGDELRAARVSLGALGVIAR